MHRRIKIMLTAWVLLVFLAGCAGAPQNKNSSESGSTAFSSTDTVSADGRSDGEESPGDSSLSLQPSDDSGTSQGASASKASGPSSLTPADSPFTSGAAVTKPDPVEELRGVWISYLELAKVGKDEKSFQTDICTMFDKIAALKMNAVIVHIRASGDAYYPSDFFPWSDKLTGTQGKNPGFDPLAIMIKAAHARGLQFHAWINPYRVSGKISDLTTLAAGNPARIWLTDTDAGNDDWAVRWSDGIYYNPAVPQVQKLILDGVREIIDRYDVDGIHFDDYFYPTTDAAFDKAAYDRYTASAGITALSLGDWRRANVNMLVQSVYGAVKAKNVIFGISPAAHISTDGTDKNYTELYADIRRWMVNPGYVDYIAPQLYFGFDYPTERFRFDRLCDQWSSLPRSKGVKLYIGLAAYKIGTVDAGSAEWQEKDDILKRQAEYLKKSAVDGLILYSYSAVASADPLCAAQIRNLSDYLQ